MPQDELEDVKEALLAARRDGNENPVIFSKISVNNILLSKKIIFPHLQQMTFENMANG